MADLSNTMVCRVCKTQNCVIKISDYMKQTLNAKFMCTLCTSNNQEKEKDKIESHLKTVHQKAPLENQSCVMLCKLKEVKCKGEGHYHCSKCSMGYVKRKRKRFINHNCKTTRRSSQQVVDTVPPVAISPSPPVVASSAPVLSGPTTASTIQVPDC